MRASLSRTKTSASSTLRLPLLTYIRDWATKTPRFARGFMLALITLLLFLHAYFLHLWFRHGFRAARLELLDAAGGVDQFFLARIERMALGTDLHFDLLLGGTHRERVAARAHNVRLGKIGRMNIFFHMLEIIA
jgi:hypothetical protein